MAEKEYIEREATLRRMKVEVKPPFAVVRDMPAADVVEVRHGEWIKDCDALVHCSVCKVARNNYFGVGGNLWHYCPNCGAKMDGKGEGE